jgi:carboxypeptidase PM20D1
VLPGRAEATVNFRLLPGETEESVIARVKSVIADDRIKVTPIPATPIRRHERPLQRRAIRR